MLEIRDLKKTYAGWRGLDGVSLQLPAGQIVGLFGENGAGKTTLLKCICGLLRYRGAITLDGVPIGRQNIARISFASCEHSFFPDLTAEAHRQFYSAHFPAFRQKRYQGLMQFFDLPAHKPLRGFSNGQKNQFEVILALCQGAEYILMDEPFAGSDVFNREDFYKLLLGLLQPQETVLLSTHLIEEVSDFVDRAVLLRAGKLVGDVLTEQLEAEGRTLEDYIPAVYGYQPQRAAQSLAEMEEEPDA